MNKVRVIGLVILLAGIITQYISENNSVDFVSAIFIGLGIGLLVTGKIRTSKE